MAETIESFSRGIERSKRPEDRKLAADYLAALAPLLARATLGESILRDLGAIERLFGHTWIIESAPFEEAFEKWRAFKAEYEQWAVSGMTVNERLHAVGLLEAFDEACNSRDVDKARELLLKVHVDEPSIQRILEQM
ncbi:MAG: hypothetical protein ACREM3_04605 [Candidatus Rokuibacteriota bacterium]